MAKRRVAGPANLALEYAIARLARHISRLAMGTLRTPAERERLVAARRALGTLAGSLATVRPEPEGEAPDAIGFAAELEGDDEMEASHGQDIDHDRGADTPEARERPRAGPRRIGF